MRQLVFDIETYGFEISSLSESQQEYLLRDANKEKDEEVRIQKSEEAERFLSLFPFTAKVVAIGMYDVIKEKAYVYYESEERKEWADEEKNSLFKGMPEKEMLESFWRVVEKTDQVISFNGRGFDVPFLMLRSAMFGIKPSKNFMGYRYDTKNHVDLLEQLSYYGTFKRFNLDFYCHAFGIKSPKSKEVSGYMVKDLYNEGRIEDIARYCGDDIFATYQLYKIWKEYLNL